jgi:ABC-type amino acid transport substrate-binding protein
MARPRRLITLVLLAGLAVEGDEPPLRVGVGVSPPYSFMSQGRPAGIEVELLAELTRIDSGLRFSGLEQFVTVGRAVEDMNSGRLDIALSAKTPERANLYDFLEPPIETVRVRLLGLRDEKQRIERFEQLAALGDSAAVLTTLGGTPHQMLRTHPGLSIDASIGGAEQQVQKLLRGRGRFVFGLESTLTAAAMQLGVADRVRWQPLAAGTLDMHLAVSRKLPAERRARLESAWKKLTSSSKLSEVIHRYRGEAIADTP